MVIAADDQGATRAESKIVIGSSSRACATEVAKTLSIVTSPSHAAPRAELIIRAEGLSDKRGS